MNTIKYIAPVFDQSGYANAARNNILAMDSVGVDITVQPISFEKQKTELKHQDRMRELTKAKPTSINILHCTPNLYVQLIQSNKYNIGYAAWETSKLPEDWAEPCNLLNELWVPSEYNKKVFQKSGVKVPIYVMPHTFCEDDFNMSSTQNILSSVDEDTYMFYSIFQWIARKNPTDLLTAYLTEFNNNDNIVLVLKSYYMADSAGTPEDSQVIKDHISSVKKALHLDNYPRIILVNDLFTEEQIFGIHKRGNCYISLTRSEGFGIPFVEAAMFNSEIIYPNYSAMPEFLNGINGTYPVRCMETPVIGMPWPQYKGDQIWAQPDIIATKQAMRNCFKKQEVHNLRQPILEKLGWATIGQQMKERISKID